MTEKEWEKKLHISTVGWDENEASERNAPYEPTPYSVRERLAASGLVEPTSYILDYGCGKGRVAFFLASQLGCRVTGIDFSEKRIGAAEENRKRFAARDRVRFIRCYAEDYEVGQEDTFFFFNPFSGKVLTVVLERILVSWYERPRRMRLICYYPSDEFAACLMTVPNVAFVEEIDCHDLFEGRNPRERIMVFEIVG